LLKASHQTKVDDDLVARCVQGDKQAENALVSACLPRVWRTVYLTQGAGPDVEDLTQIAMIHAVEKLHSYRGPDKFFAWLDRLTVNVVRQHKRRRILKLMEPASHRIETMATDKTDMLDRRLEMRQLLARLAEHVSHLRPKKRTALVLSIVHGYSAEEIGDIVGCSQEAAWKRCQRGYKELVQRIKRDPNFEQALQELLP